MSNHHLRDRQISLRAIGLLSVMLSLPDDWDYTVAGLTIICKDSEERIRAALQELETAGYVQRRRVRDKKGRLRAAEYAIREIPQQEEPVQEKPVQENPAQDGPVQENPAQIIKDKRIKEIKNTDQQNTQSLLSAVPGDTEVCRERIRKQIEYDILKERLDVRLLDELVEIMTEVAVCRGGLIRLGASGAFPRTYVQERFAAVRARHIEQIMFAIADSSYDIRNPKAYLLHAIFNSVTTSEHRYAYSSED